MIKYSRIRIKGGKVNFANFTPPCTVEQIKVISLLNGRSKSNYHIFTKHNRAIVTLKALV